MKENRIYLTRGDSASIKLSITDSIGSDYEAVAGDKIYFRLKRTVFGSTLVLVKEIAPSTLTLEFSPNDTARLDFATYRYEVELAAANGSMFTVIEDGELVIGPELESHDV